LKKPTANHLQVILKNNTETHLKIVEVFTIISTDQFTESQAAS
jgi:hypothetical protein